MAHEQLSAALFEKNEINVEALGHYSAFGWTISILPWVEAWSTSSTFRPLWWKEGIENKGLASLRPQIRIFPSYTGYDLDSILEVELMTENNGQNNEEEDTT